MVSMSGTVAADAEPVLPRPRRWLRRLIAFTLAVLVLLVLIVGGVAWYFSGVALAVHHDETFPHRVLVSGPVVPGTGTGAGAGAVAVVRLSRDVETAQPGVLALVWDGGQGRVGPVLSGDAESVTRQFTVVVGGVPTPGTRVRVDSYAWLGTPSSASGLPYAEVGVPGPLGLLPAWFVPAGGPASGAAASGAAASGAAAPGGPASGGDTSGSAGRTWIVFVHGHDGDRQESLRYLRAWHDLGYPVLVTSYRNDVGAPSSPDHRHHLGDTEWQDVAAAVRWARDRGAGGVVLAGLSMGGAIALQVADRSDVAPLVRGLVLDSPVIDWRRVFASHGAARGLPGPQITLAEQVLQWRAGIDLDRLDWVARAGQLRVPTILLNGDSDDYVPEGPTNRLAASRPDLVTLVRIPGARHTMSWNVDPVRYETAVREWLARLPR